MTAKQLREQRAKLIADSRTMLDKAHGENRDLSPEEDASFAKINGDIDRLGKQIERLERQEQLEADAARINDHGFGDETPASGAGSLGGARDQARRREPEGIDGGGQGRLPQVEAQALALQGWARYQAGMRPSERHVQAARQCRVNLRARHFDVGLGRNFGELRRDFRNALSVGTATAGGNTVPRGFVSALEAAMLQFGPMQQVADVLRTSRGNALPWPTMNDTGNTGEQIDEAATVGASVDPTFGQLVLNAWKFSSKLVQVSSELLQDSEFDLAEVLGAALGERLGRIKNTRFTVGVGTTTAKGIVVAATLGKTAASATAIVYDEVIDLEHSVERAYRNAPGAGYMCHDNIVLALRKLKDGQGQYLWQQSANSGQPDLLNSRPLFVNNDMASAITTGQKTLIFGQLSKYKIREVSSIRLRRLVERYADTDQEAFIAFHRADGNLLDAGVAPVKYLAQL